MQKKQIFLIGIIALAVISFTSIHSLVEYIPPGKVGVRTTEFSPLNILGKKGVVAKDYKAGWHFKIPSVITWTLFDITVQTLDRKISVQSADGYAITVDATIKYRLKQGMCYKVYQDTGSGLKYQVIVQNQSRSTCMALLGTIKTEDFYNPDERRKKAEEVKELLSNNLTDNFVEIIEVLIRNVEFDPGYEAKIRRKKLADQEVELNKSLAKAEGKKGETQVIEAETGKLVKIITKEKEAELIRMEALTNRDIAKIKAEYEKYSTQKKADADLIAAQKEAEGNLLVKKAEAEGEKLRNKAMQGVGGSTIVALEAAKNLKLSDVTVSSLDVDFLDLDAMATKLGVNSKK